MDTSALINAIATDESRLDSLLPWLYLASAVVIVGLAIELTPDIRKLHWWHWDRDLFIEVLGGAIVTMAIGGELFVTYLASRAETSLRLDNQKYVALLEQEAAVGMANAANAIDAAQKATDRAAKAETEAATLLKENVELERAIEPRTIDQAALIESVNDLQRVPIFVSSVNREEPKEVLDELGAFSGIKLGDMPTWSVTVLPSGDSYPPGISIMYVEDRPDDTPQKAVAIAICKNLRDQGIAISADGIGSNMKAYEREWPAEAPHNAVIIRIGAKPNNFWINKLLWSKGQKEIETTSFCTMEESIEAWKKKNRELREQKLAPPKN